ncbi:AEC family transporter [Aquisalimonas lutea]|uniref:AEC family transporter n=1 Tax=Aquisalimonas lutea TaxID=1327750 RepID=UPI0033906799
MLAIVNILAPVFLVILLGWALARTGFLPGQALAELNRLCYWVGVPCLLFYRVSTAQPDVGGVTGLLLVCGLATVLAIGVAGLVGLALGLPGRAYGTFMQGVFRGNLAFIGLPVVLYAFPDSAGSAETSALLVFGPLVVLYNVLAVVVLVLSGGGSGHGLVRPALYGLVTNPILVASLGGLLVALAGIPLPEVAGNTISAIGQMALPLALICIGGTLYTTRIQGSLGRALAGAGMKVAAVPLIGFALAWAVGLSDDHTRIALILLACPTASVSYVLARQLRGDEALASSIVVLSNFLAVPAMFVVLALG